jgi:hypothetical protein|tara:strand:- start:1644 stop:3074 length:1431 start_codon:yes stop_codon:yes gene_type:complete
MKINLFKNETLFVILIILFGLLLRAYNISFNDFWSDEMVTFYLSNPNLNFTETIKLIFETNLMVSYELTLKFFHKIFGYDLEYSRYLTLFFSIISIFYFYKLIKNNKNYHSAILGVILLSINIYHIRYSIELRSYTLTFLLSIILLNLIFFQGKIREFKNFFSYFLIFTISFFMLFSHAYSIIVIISINFYIFLLWIIKKNFSKNNTLLFLSTSISSLLFILIHINNIFVHTPDWIPEFKSSFFTNYYFSSFFGSRILGLLHLIILIYLITTQFSKVLKKFNIELFLIIFLLLTYMIPIAYSLIFKPVLIDRYIFFVLIPILYLISGLSFDLKNIYKKYTFIFLLVAPSFLNHFSENTFKQFYTDIYPSKPEVRKSLEHIVKNNNFNYSFVSIENNPYKINFAYENYLTKYSKKIDKNLMYFNYANNTELPDNIWLIYFTDITNEKFVKPVEFKDYIIKSNKIFNHLELYQLKKTD